MILRLCVCTLFPAASLTILTSVSSSSGFCKNCLPEIISQGQTAEFVSKYVDKGARIGIVGQLQVDSWTDKATGEARNRAKIVVRDLDILESRAEAELRRGEKQQRGRSFYAEDDDDEDFSGPSKAGTGGFFDMM